MSVGIKEVVENAGYDVKFYKDAEWILGQKDDWEELLEQAQETLDQYEEIEAEF